MPDAWLRLERKGGQVTASTSGDGTSWTVLDSATVALPETLLAGISADAADTGKPTLLALKASVCDIDVVSGDASPRFRRADADGSGLVELTDAVTVLGFLFQGLAAPTCLDAADTDDSGTLDLSDGVVLLSFLFLGGTEPPAPGPFTCGADTTPSADIGTPCVYERCP